MDKFGIDTHKIHYHPQRVTQWLKNPQKTFPIYVEISPVGQCNHRCTFCAVDYIGYVNRQLPTDVLKKCIKNMSKCGVKSIMFAGEGEPLLHKNLPEIINYTKECSIDVGITSNGTAMTKKWVDKCIDSITWIKLSVNAGDARTYGQVHRTKEKHWDIVWDNVGYAVSKRDKNKTAVGVQAVAIPDNLHSLPSLCEKGQDAGVDYCVIKPYSQHKMSETEEYADVSYEDEWVENTFLECECYEHDDYEVIVRRKSIETWEEKGRRYCKCYSTPYFWAYIMATGDVYGCSAYLKDDRFKYGNIKDNTFKDIWLGEKRRKSMEYVKNTLDISECRKNCRMEKVNQYLWNLKEGVEHENFI